MEELKLKEEERKKAEAKKLEEDLIKKIYTQGNELANSMNENVDMRRQLEDQNSIIY